MHCHRLHGLAANERREHRQRHQWVVSGTARMRFSSDPLLWSCAPESGKGLGSGIESARLLGPGSRLERQRKTLLGLHHVSVNQHQHVVVALRSASGRPGLRCELNGLTSALGLADCTVCSLLAGLVADRFGRKKALVIGLIGMALCRLGIAVIAHGWLIVASNLLFGVVDALVIISISGFLMENSTVEE